VTITELGSLGELIAAVATVVTLAYLALQIRQNTRAIRGSATRESLDLLNSAHQPMLNNPELGSRFFRGLTNPDSLSEDEAAQFTLALYTVVGTFQTLFFQRQQALLDRDIFDHQTRALVTYFYTPGGKRWWDSVASQFTPQFRDFINGQLEATRGSARNWRTGEELPSSSIAAQRGAAADQQQPR
jgi:hypothetical protein